MDARPNYERAHFRCFPCGIVVRGLKRFVRHCTNVIHVAPYRCAYCNAGSTQHLRSLVRHLKNHHPNGENGLDGAGNVDDVDMNVDQNAEVNLENENDDLVDGGQHDDAEVSDHDANEEEGVELPGPDAIQDLCQAAARCTLNLRQASGVTTSAVQRFQVECNQMIRTVTDNNLIRVREFLTAEGIDSPASRALLQELQLEDPFRHVRSLKQQLNYFAREFGMVKPKTCFIGYRQDYFLNPATGQYEPVQVPMSFEYISIIETITSALSNPKIRNLIESETPSADGTIRSYLDGTRSQSRVLLTRYPKIIRLQLYWDDLEVVNALGSKTTIHKLAGFYVSIQNLPAIENSQLSSILLLALAHSEDLKVDNGFDSVLAPFLGELRKLESDRGVNIIVDGQPFVLRATLTTLVADTLAAHDIIGLLGPGARCFCRKCLVTRQEFLANTNAMGPRRTKASFQEHVRQVSERPAFATECGVRRECPLHFTREFDAMQDSVFDIFHDFLEGVCQWDISLALRTFIKYDNLFTVQDFNDRLVSFNYGIMDKKNKPTPNFTNDSLRGKKLKQNGCQVWCLIRIFGFLVPEVPDDNLNLKLVNILQRVMLIAFSDKARRPQDIDAVRDLVTEHNALFQQLYMNVGQAVLEDEDEGIEAEEENVDEPAVVVENNTRRVRAGNKLHHLKHLAEQLEELACLIRYWTARYEGRHKIFSQYGAVCCNFINSPKSMAQMFQMSTLAGYQNTTPRGEDIEVSAEGEVPVEATDHSAMLIAAGLIPGSLVEICRSVKVAGDEYRPGLFVLYDVQPTFAIIQRIYVCRQDVYFIVQPWVTEGFVNRFCAYEVTPSAVHQHLVMEHKHLANHRCFAPWNPWRSRRTFIAPRTIIF